MTERELYHHGIKGQKWGVRRFQNRDGTLTEEGKRRYDKYLDARDRNPEIYEKYEKRNTGLTRYQNKDGSLTKEGKKRFGSVSELSWFAQEMENDAKSRGSLKGLAISTAISIPAYAAGVALAPQLMTGLSAGIMVGGNITMQYYANKGKEETWKLLNAGKI